MGRNLIFEKANQWRNGNLESGILCSIKLCYVMQCCAVLCYMLLCFEMLLCNPVVLDVSPGHIRNAISCEPSKTY